MKDVTVPERFPKAAVAATRDLCKYNQGTNTYGNPSLAMKLGYLLKKSARVETSEALMSERAEYCKGADDWLKMNGQRKFQVELCRY